MYKLLILTVWLLMFSNMEAKEFKRGPGGPVVGGYYRSSKGWHKSHPVSKLPLKYYTHVFNIGHARYNFDNCRINPDPGDKWPDIELRDAVRKNNGVIILSLGGKAADFERIAASKKHLKAYVSDLIKLLDKADFDGIDLDWEHPHDKKTGKLWCDMMRAFRKELDQLSKKKNRKMFLTTALPSWDTFQYLDYELLANDLDMINIMTYDMGWNTAGDTCPLFTDPEAPYKDSLAHAFSNLKKFKVPMDRVIMGVAFYAYIFKNCKPFDKYDYSNVQSDSYPGLLKLIRDNAMKPEFNKKTGSTWYFTDDRKLFFAMPLPVNIRNKSAWVLKNGGKGIFSWSIGLDDLENGGPLSRAMNKPWKDKISLSK